MLFRSLRSFADFTQILNGCLSNMRVKDAVGTNGRVKYVHLALLTHTMVFCDEWSGKVSRGGTAIAGFPDLDEAGQKPFSGAVTREGR